MSKVTRFHVLLLLLSFCCLSLSAVDKDGNFVIVIDPGHGGKDPGAMSGKNTEKSINLNVALKMGQLIERNCRKVKVIYTRKTDVFIELNRRGEIANKANADLFVSIHTNSAKSSSARGAETYLLGVEENRTSANLSVAMEENKAILYESDYQTRYEGYDPKSPESQIIFEFMQNEYQKESLKFAGMVQKQMVSQARRSDRGVHQAGFLVLWKTAMPSILVELGFISNSDDCRYMTSQKGVEELATSLYKAFVSYLEDYRKQTAKSVNLTQTASGSSKSTVQDTRQASSGTTSSPVFKIQFLLSKEELKSSDSRIRNLPDVDYYKEGGQYKYTCGNTSDYNEITRLQAEVRKRYKDAFVIAFLNGSKITVREAREIIDRNGR
ncbi:MAG: N-acetylmuramoyl-L-alanine amidase [Bacteroidaceae bacterium]|nr:N-acetylmuramoyl-L-alanine amidase [Bacteroidaceae bacterium]